MDTFDKVLRKRIKASGQTIPHLAKESGVPPATINNWQRGHVRSPRDWTGIVRLAAALHLQRTDVDHLLVAASHQPLAELLAEQEPEEQGLFQPWIAELKRSIPMQPPRASDVFVDRHDEMRFITNQLERGGTAVVIEGMTGSGKTELAIQAAQRLRTRYPQGIVWDGPGSSSLAATVASLTHGLDLHLDASMSLGSRAAALRSALGGRRCLIVFDGVEDADAIEPLLPTRWSQYAVIVTTQDGRMASRLRVPVVTIEGFRETVPAAIDLYDSVLGKEYVNQHRRTFSSIAAACGHLPLALAITAWQLESRVQEPADLLRLLGSEDKLDALTFDSKAIRTVLDLAVDHLSPAAREMLQVMSVFPGHDVSDQAVADLASVELGDCRKHLTELRVRSLLLQGRRQRRHRLHTLVRDYMLDSFDARQLQERLVQHFVEAAESHRFDSLWFAEEETHFQGVLEHARSFPEVDWFVRGVISVSPYWVLTGHLDQAAEFLEEALGCTDIATMPRLRAQASRWLAHVEDLHGNVDRAIQLTQDGIAELQGFDLPSELCALQIALASTLGSANQIERAEELLKSALETARALKLSNRICDAVLNLGGILRNRGEYEEARRLYKEAIPIARELGDADRLNGLFNNLGVVESDLGNYDEAERLYQNAVDLSQQLGDALGQCNALLNLGNTAWYKGDLHGAAERYWQALQVARRTRLSEVLVTAYINVAVAAINLGNPARAEWYLLKGQVVARRDHRHERLLIILETLGGVAYAAGRYPQALEYYEAELESARSSGQRLFEANARARLGEVHTQLGNWEAAEQTLDEAARLMQTMEHARGITEVAHHQAELQHACGNTDSAKERIATALEHARDLGHQERLSGVLATQALCSLAEEEVEEARQAALESLGIARSIDHPFSLAEALRSLGEVELMRGETAAADRAFSELATIGSQIGYRLAEARGLFGRARARSQDNLHRTSAQNDARRALTILQELDHYEVEDVVRFIGFSGMGTI